MTLGLSLVKCSAPAAVLVPCTRAPVCTGPIVNGAGDIVIFNIEHDPKSRMNGCKLRGSASATFSRGPARCVARSESETRTLEPSGICSNPGRSNNPHLAIGSDPNQDNHTESSQWCVHVYTMMWVYDSSPVLTGKERFCCATCTWPRCKQQQQQTSCFVTWNTLSVVAIRARCTPDRVKYRSSTSRARAIARSYEQRQSTASVRATERTRKTR